MGADERAIAWREHLRAGGTTPWTDYDAAPGSGADDSWLPGAQQLELLRRVNQLGPARPELAEAILRAPLPFRGLPDLALPGTEDPGLDPDPLDPAELPDDELVRVAVAVLAPVAVRRPVPAASGAPGAPGGRVGRVVRRIARRPYRLVGDPVLVPHVRRSLVAEGRDPGDGGDVLVVGASFDRMLADAWRHRVRTHGAPPWRAWLDLLVTRDRVPPAIDLPTIAERWAAERPDRVVVCTSPGAAGARAGGRRTAGVPDDDAATAELERRIGMLLGVLVPSQERTRLLRRGVLPPGVRPARPTGLPLTPRAHAWARRQARRMAARVEDAGYPVAGGLDALAPAGQPRSDVKRLTLGGVLPLAVTALHAVPPSQLQSNGENT